MIEFKPMRIVVAGGTGFLGRALAERLRRGAHDVTVLSRRPRGIGDVAWSPGEAAGAWTSVVQAADAVINLAGESIAGGRWTAARKDAIRHSRIAATSALVKAIRAAARPPLFISASAVGI